MSTTMFIVGFIIFSLYMYVMIWSIFYNSKKQREENYPNLNGMGEVDYDGMGDFSRFGPTEKMVKVKRKRRRKSKV